MTRNKAITPYKPFPSLHFQLPSVPSQLSPRESIRWPFSLWEVTITDSAGQYLRIIHGWDHFGPKQTVVRPSHP